MNQNVLTGSKPAAGRQHSPSGLIDEGKSGAFLERPSCRQGKQVPFWGHEKAGIGARRVLAQNFHLHAETVLAGQAELALAAR